MASIEKRSESTYRITVSCGYGTDGKKLFKKKTFAIDSTLTEKQKEKKLNELAVLFEKEVRDSKLLDDTQKCFIQFLQLNNYDVSHFDIKQIEGIMAGTQKHIEALLYCLNTENVNNRQLTLR